LQDSVVPPKGARLYSGDREVGWISSAVQAPGGLRTLALGFPLRDFGTPGTSLTVEVNGTRHEVTVQTLPFYERGSR
jgi:aminomethyltransferase